MPAFVDASPADFPAMREAAERTGAFSREELGFIAEIGEALRAQGAASGYRALLLRELETLLGFAIYGPIPGTQNRFDLYWIATVPGAQRKGTGKRLLGEVARRVRVEGGRRLFIETSSRGEYAPAHALYRASGFPLIAEVPDYYADGDALMIFGGPV